MRKNLGMNLSGPSKVHTTGRLKRKKPKGIAHAGQLVVLLFTASLDFALPQLREALEQP